MVNIFNVFYKTIDGDVLKCARVQLEENTRGDLERVYFSYHPDFLAHNKHPVDPRILPLSTSMVELVCDKEAPGFIDDILPDDWGKKVLARLHQVARPTISQLLSFMDYSTVGALQFTAENQTATPVFALGCEKREISSLQSIANNIDLGLASAEDIERIKLNMFARGSSVGGARPKVLVHEGKKAYIAKFARQTDLFDYAVVEHACLELMKSAGLNVADSHVDEVDGKNVLFVERFDISTKGGRYHQITANGLLKSPHDQSDPYIAKYDHLAKLIGQYSCDPLKDQQQLFCQMLFNMALNNTDDHLRNFSFSCRENGWQLSPVYDVVPSIAFGQYHQLQVGYSDYLPSFKDAVKFAGSFKLTKEQAGDLVERVEDVVADWQNHFKNCGVGQADIATLSKVFKR